MSSYEDVEKATAVYNRERVQAPRSNWDETDRNVSEPTSLPMNQNSPDSTKYNIDLGANVYDPTQNQPPRSLQDEMNQNLKSTLDITPTSSTRNINSPRDRYPPLANVHKPLGSAEVYDREQVQKPRSYRDDTTLNSISTPRLTSTSPAEISVFSSEDLQYHRLQPPGSVAVYDREQVQLPQSFRDNTAANSGSKKTKSRKKPKTRPTKKSWWARLCG